MVTPVRRTNDHTFLSVADTLRSLAKEHFYETVLAVNNFSDSYTDDENESVIKTHSGDQSDKNHTLDRGQESCNSEPMKHYSQNNVVIPCRIDASPEIDSYHSLVREDKQEEVTMTDTGEQFDINNTFSGHKQSDDTMANKQDDKDNVKITCDGVVSPEASLSLETLSASYEEMFVDASSRDRPWSMNFSFADFKPLILERRSSSIPEDNENTATVPSKRNFQSAFPKALEDCCTKQHYQPIDAVEENNFLESDKPTSGLSGAELLEIDHNVIDPSKILPPGVSFESYLTDSELCEIMKGKLEHGFQHIAGTSNPEETSETDSWFSAKLFSQESYFNVQNQDTAENSLANVNRGSSPDSGSMIDTHLSLGSLVDELSETETVKENKDYRKDEAPSSRSPSALDIDGGAGQQLAEDGITTRHVSPTVAIQELPEGEIAIEDKFEDPNNYSLLKYTKSTTRARNSRRPSAIDMHDRTELQPVEDDITTWQVSPRIEIQDLSGGEIKVEDKLEAPSKYRHPQCTKSTSSSLYYRCFSRQIVSYSSSSSCFDEDEVLDLDEDLLKKTSEEQRKQMLFQEKLLEHLMTYNSDIETSGTDVYSNCSTSEDERLSRPESPDVETDVFDEEANDLKSQQHHVYQFSTKEYVMKYSECQFKSLPGSLPGSSRQFDTYKNDVASDEGSSSNTLSGSYQL